MKPRPPSCANAIAKRASVTVSIDAETIGRFSSIVFVRRVLRLAVCGNTVEWPGTNSTSSKVKASLAILSICNFS